jgi:hypothetical protein
MIVKKKGRIVVRRRKMTINREARLAHLLVL